MTETPEISTLLNGLPDPEGAERFYAELTRQHPNVTKRLNEALRSDLLTIAAYSPLLATTLLQNPPYVAWLGRERTDTKVRSKEELLESLSRFALLHTDVEANVMLARFRRRELLRIYLRDIRKLATVTEITDELSNLADAVVEFALRLAKQDLENRFGVPLETDERGRSIPAGFCVVALGKLGSRELNYASDIDLLFIYSREGATSDIGTAGSVTNREYFIKLAEKVISIAGGQSGEGAAYRIDMRLRPHGSIGRLALSLDESIRYYTNEAREWEQQVLIRSRAIAGEPPLFKTFYTSVERFVFRPDADPAETLSNVRMSRQRIEDPVPPGPGYNVKLGRGGIREIEFISQALQLAHGGRDIWLRYPHTLVSLSRLADRGFITEKQLTSLFDAYEFFRQLEHRLQMEHGLQTHTVPKNEPSHYLTTRRMGFDIASELDREINRHAMAVNGVFEKIFAAAPQSSEAPIVNADIQAVRSEREGLIGKFAAVSPHFAQILASTPEFSAADDLDFEGALSHALLSDADFGKRLSTLRRTWSRLLLGIVFREINGDLDIRHSKDLQNALAEASIRSALIVMRDEVESRFGIPELELSVLALGKLGGGGVDYGSDLDLVLVYDDRPDGIEMTATELYNRAVEIFVTILSGMTRDGNLYRVDLRLRPYGKNGASSNPRSALIEYFRNTANVWELLAFVKLRGVAGNIAIEVENQVRDIIHGRAAQTSPDELRDETLRIRGLLELEKGGRHRDSDIKYGPGGMLDVYFATRYLQLRDNIPDDPQNRSTTYVLEMLWEKGALSEPDYETLSAGYSFLAQLDHHIRLLTGRSRRLPSAAGIQDQIAARMNLTDREALAQNLALHRINIRKAFEKVMGT